MDTTTSIHLQTVKGCFHTTETEEELPHKPYGLPSRSKYLWSGTLLKKSADHGLNSAEIIIVYKEGKT